MEKIQSGQPHQRDGVAFDHDAGADCRAAEYQEYQVTCMNCGAQLHVELPENCSSFQCCNCHAQHQVMVAVPDPGGNHRDKKRFMDSGINQRGVKQLPPLLKVCSRARCPTCNSATCTCGLPGIKRKVSESGPSDTETDDGDFEAEHGREDQDDDEDKDWNARSEEPDKRKRRKQSKTATRSNIDQNKPKYKDAKNSDAPATSPSHTGNPAFGSSNHGPSSTSTNNPNNATTSRPYSAPPARQFATLTAEQAQEVYKKRPHGSEKEQEKSIMVAKEFNANPKTVRDIWGRRMWLQATRPLWSDEEVKAQRQDSDARRRVPPLPAAKPSDTPEPAEPSRQQEMHAPSLSQYGSNVGAQGAAGGAHASAGPGHGVGGGFSGHHLR